MACRETSVRLRTRHHARGTRTTRCAVSRPSFVEIYMRMAHEIARRSTCVRTSSAGEAMHVGCVIVTPDFRKMLSLGYNGNASGLPNECDSDVPGSCGCLHAECNAAINCDVPRTTEKLVFCTHLPCANCSKILINLGGVRSVYYAKDYRIRTSLALFNQVGIDAVMMESK